MPFVLSPSELAAYNAQRPAGDRGSACHAPSAGLYIGIAGMVSACCVNRTHPLGRYPEQSLEEIWFGEGRRKMAAALAVGDLGRGCQTCYHAIRSGNFAGLSAQVYDGLPRNPRGFPSKIDFELDNKCNLECLMCRGERSSAIRRNREHLPPIPMPYDEAFLGQLAAFLPHLRDAHFLGGEPFMIPIYLDIWERMIQLSPLAEVSVQTNATLLSDRVKSILEAMRFSIAVSIDAIDPDLYAQIRVNGHLPTVVTNIDYLRAYCRRKGTMMSISYTPMTLNWHELPDVVRWCNARELPLFFNTLSHPRRLALSALPAPQLAMILDQLEAATLPDGSALERANRKAYSDLMQLIRYWHGQAVQSASEPPLRVAEDMEAYQEGLVTWAQGQGLAASVVVDVRSKLERLLRQAEDMRQLEAVHDHILTVDYPTLFNYVPRSSDAELLAGIQGVLMD